MSRVKVKKRGKPLDPAVVEVVAEATKGYRYEIIAQEERIQKLEALAHNMAINIDNLSVVFGDLHTCFATLGSSIDFGSAKAAVKELAELAERSLADYEVPPEDPSADAEVGRELHYFWREGSSIDEDESISNITVYDTPLGLPEMIALNSNNMVRMEQQEIEFCIEYGLIPDDRRAI